MQACGADFLAGGITLLCRVREVVIPYTDLFYELHV